MKATLEHENLADHVRIVLLPRSGGLIGIRQFFQLYHGNGDVIVVGGLAMIGTDSDGQDAVSMNALAPIARLTGEWEVLAVRCDSGITSIAKLRDDLRDHPNRLRWVGRAMGGIDHGLVWSMARQTGTPIDRIIYDTQKADNGVARSVIERRGDVGVSGYTEFKPFVMNGTLRILAVAAPSRVSGINAPPLIQNGINLSFMNWVAVFAPPGVNRAERHRLDTLIHSMVATHSWQNELRKGHWVNNYLDGAALSGFMANDQRQWMQIIGTSRRNGNTDKEHAPGINTNNRLTPLLIAAAMGCLAILAWLSMGLWRRSREAASLRDQCSILVNRLDESSTTANQRIMKGIQDDFSDWHLSLAERDVAWFMLRGLPFQQIASLRGTSERTVRQQAQAIYRKAGLDSRSDLAGRVLERFI